MKIASIQLTENTTQEGSNLGLKEFGKIKLGEIVILTGENGSGKTRLLKLLVKHIESLRKNKSNPSFQPSSGLVVEVNNNGKIDLLTREFFLSEDIHIVNYSHFDALLQIPDGFSPYVISQAKDILRACNYEETALNSLLLIEDMAKGYSKEFEDGITFRRFVDFLRSTFDIALSFDADTKELRICESNLHDMADKKAELSPGQQYLLRIAVACFCNDVEDELVFILDEPELHLHPKALIKMIETLRAKFINAQFWISTHSLALISDLSVSDMSSTILYMKDGKPELFRSDSSELLNGLIGKEDNQFAIRQLFSLPEEYACVKFAAECFQQPDPLSASGHDPQTGMILPCLGMNDLILDYGAGKGRFLEELALADPELTSKIQYYAYDKFDTYSDECKEIMDRYGSTRQNYSNDLKLLSSKLNQRVDYVLLVNVLHEISPKDWRDVFSSIHELLKESGKLIIVEREELMIGETPYDYGFLMLAEEGADSLFGSSSIKCFRHENKKHIVKYIVNKDGVLVDDARIVQCVECIRDSAFREVRKLKELAKPDYSKDLIDKEKFRNAIRLAFYMHQYVNSLLLKEELG